MKGQPVAITFETNDKEQVALKSLKKGGTFKASMAHLRRKRRPGDATPANINHYIISEWADEEDDLDEGDELRAVNISTGHAFELKEFTEKVTPTNLVMREE